MSNDSRKIVSGNGDQIMKLAGRVSTGADPQVGLPSLILARKIQSQAECQTIGQG
jgi:hypothetical protein